MTQPKDTPILVAQTGSQSGQRWSLSKDELIIGRGADCDVMIDDKTVSRHHAKIVRETDKWLLVDTSKNGVHVNGQAVQEKHELQDSDVIAIATAAKLVFIASEATLPLSLSLPKGGRLKLDVLSRRVWVHGHEIDPPFSLPQYRLLELLYARNGEICTREDVIKSVWPEAQIDGVSEQSIDALVRRLRDRLSESDADHQYIVTVRGHGFRLDNPSQ
ncbi:MAG: FHA domain-containing protein [Chloroflexi bacterium]|nr:FHA domain-containing protein [Chloroflexota bacterium]MBI5713313.1 FHA domain-containing protein [Chloroflexota bacterium]